MMHDPDHAWNAFMARDRGADGRFVVAVKTTGIYCKPSCPARRPRRENIAFYATPVEARHAGYRECLRCKPDEVGRDRRAVRRAIELLNGAEGAMPLADLAEAVGYAPHHFQRLFARDVGISPAAYARAMRAGRLETALTKEEHVTDAIYDAGYGSAASAYSDAGDRFGMTPRARAKGGAGQAIRWTVIRSSLGPMLVAATAKGLCRISFDEGEQELRTLFPNADLLPPDAEFRSWVQQVVALVDDPARAASDLPVDVKGTAFQQAVWKALRAIPAGETRSYSQIADAAGRPKAVRAAGSACGDNDLAVLIPCHRVLRGDGSLGGYAYGLERKKALLEREKA